MWGELPQACAPGTKGRRDDVILTGLDEESDSTNEEMPPLEPLEPLEELPLPLPLLELPLEPLLPLPLLEEPLEAPLLEASDFSSSFGTVR